MKGGFLFTIICIIQLLEFSVLYGQEDTLRYELFFTNDNDSYVMIRSDRYYTNGISAGFVMRLGKKSPSPNSLEFNIQHRIYNGVAVLKEGKKYWDRPFSGVLSFQSFFRHFFDANRQLAIGLNFEQVGPKAKAEEIQNFIHEVFRIYEVVGWDSQLPNLFGVDVGAYYLEDFYASSNFSIGTKLDAVVGMNNIYFQAGFPIRLGKIKKLNQSVFSQASVNSDDLNNEFFVFYKPSLSYQVKNSSIHNWDLMELKHPDNTVQPYIFTQDLGVTYAKGKSALSFSLIQYTSEMKPMKYKRHTYGRIHLSRRF